jgi:hypothetical protein
MRQSTYSRQDRSGLQIDAVGKASDAALKLADDRAGTSNFSLERREFAAQVTELVSRGSRRGAFENAGAFPVLDADAALAFEDSDSGLRRVQRYAVRRHQFAIRGKVRVDRVLPGLNVTPERVSYALASWTVCGFIGHLSSHLTSLPLS